MLNLILSPGAISYTGLDEFKNLKRDVLFCFDLKLPEIGFDPVAVDGEVDSFALESLDWVLHKLVEGGSRGYKPNCNLVVIDFLLRHGIIPPEAPYYLDLVASLRCAELG